MLFLQQSYELRTGSFRNQPRLPSVVIGMQSPGSLHYTQVITKVWNEVVILDVGLKGFGIKTNNAVIRIQLSDYFFSCVNKIHRDAEKKFVGVTSAIWTTTVVGSMLQLPLFSVNQVIMANLHLYFNDLFTSVRDDVSLIELINTNTLTAESVVFKECQF